MKDGWLIHIGYHKTGSSFLQRKVFPKFAANTVIMPDVGYIAESKPYEPEVFRAQMHAASTGASHARTILSQETLSGRGNGNPMWDPHLIAGRLKETYPEARILIVLREQFDYILSLYSYRVVQRGLETRGLEAFVREWEEHLVRKLRYDRLVARYFDLFGKENVLVALYEDLATDPPRFIERIVRFAGFDMPDLDLSKRVNPGTRTRRSVAINRVVNFPCDQITGALRKWGILGRKPYEWIAVKHYQLKNALLHPLVNRLDRNASPLEFPEALKDRLLPAFAQSNRELSALTGIDLSTLGYCHA